MCILTYKSVLLICWTLCQIRLFEFIWVEGGVKFIKYFKGGASYERLGTSDIDTITLRFL
jgi:hypothetical protein